MALSVYQSSVPIYIRQLNGLSAVLEKAIAYCAEKKIDPKALLQDRIFADMLPFTVQISLTCGYAERGAARLAGGEPPKRDDKMETLEDMKRRVAEALAFVKTVDSAKMEGMDTRNITFPAGPREMTMTGADYLLHFNMPNFYFHMTTAYAILRHNGVPLGKSDYMGSA